MQKIAPVIRVRTPPMPRGVTRLWILMCADITGVIWTATLGPWFDRTSQLTSIVTLNGHHPLVIVLAGAAFTMLCGLALTTYGFQDIRPHESALIGVAVIMSIVALAGFVSLVLTIAAAGLFLGLLVRLFF
jgi:hypothetical protein